MLMLRPRLLLRGSKPITHLSRVTSLFQPHHQFRLISNSTAAKASTTAQSVESAIDTKDLFTPEQRAIAAQKRLDGLGPFVSRLPKKWIPYAELMRLEKPVGTWLLYIPCTWSILIAATMTGATIPATAGILTLFGAGSLIMRGFGCTINDVLDRNLDNKVLRTIERPVASGRVTVPQAIKFMGGQLAVGLVLLLCLPFECLALGAISLLPVCTYPLFKRFTHYPQAVLSTAFNWGALLGFPAMGIWDIQTMIPLYLSSYCWTMTYDTIYAHQDKKFDAKAGIKSTALAWGDHSKKIFTGLTFAQVSLLGLAGANAGLLTSPGFLVGTGIFAYRLFKMIKDVNLDDPKDCWKKFEDNISSGLVLTYGLAFDYLLMAFGFL